MSCRNEKTLTFIVNNLSEFWLDKKRNST